ncbi:hypothetical protein B0A79_21910 [Flavobacterium piscis]|uniref:Uncharacterized protein n=1 Tax=Flavobacterium piscis TaxID=1114874 RepID=A0ABX2XUU2_9FLAO|nr:hypothetical protein [Flavobacterium piscis]OCB78351.1 hypothetical protein FLP_01230 [Flavobacterium piscis]OXE97161.1 hypothetical protein B0A79_21910 [Flavobacterium piscis]
MNILRKKDEILAALGNIRAMERLHVDTHTEEKIKNISGIKIAESKQGQFWLNFQELNGFLFMNSTILSHINLKTSRGAKIILLTKEYEIEIDSDEIEIESDFSNVSNTWITKVSFVIDIKEKEIIENRNFEEIEYQFKKEKLRFFAKNKNQLLT